MTATPTPEQYDDALTRLLAAGDELYDRLVELKDEFETPTEEGHEDEGWLSVDLSMQKWRKLSKAGVSA